MKKWTVEVDGTPGELEIAEALSLPPTWSITRRDSVYVLESDDFASMEGSIDVSNHATSYLLPMINAVAALSRQGHRFGGVRIGHGLYVTHEDGTGTGFRTVRSSVSLSFPGEVSAIARGKVIQQSPTLQQMGSALRHDPHVRDALFFFGQPGNWAFNLDKVADIIGSDLGGAQKIFSRPRRWTDQKRMDRFRRSVNSPSVWGPDARHPYGNPDREKGSVPMSRDECRSFIACVLKKWLRWKYDRL